MSSGFRNVVINPRERAISTDINRLQSMIGYLENHISYADNAERYIFFSKCVVNLAQYLPWRAEVVHVHDWQVALVPALILQQKKAGWGNPPTTCLTIHNLAYQGVFPAEAFKLTNLPGDF